MDWVPVHSSHAIERVRFELAFLDRLPSKTVDALRRKFETTRGPLRFEPTQDQKIHNIFIGGSGPTSQTVHPDTGWVSLRMKGSSKNAAEALSISNLSLAYESTEYRDWSTAQRRFWSVCKSLIEYLIDVVDVKGVSHDYNDRFVFSGDPFRADARDLLDGSLLAAIPEDATSGKELWHLHRGWFVIRDGQRFLVNQNLDIQEGHNHRGERARSLQLYTKADLVAGDAKLGLDEIEKTIQSLHMICNSVFAGALSKGGRELLKIDEEGTGGHE